MINNITYKNLLLTIISTFLTGSLGFYLLFTYKIWPFNNFKTKNLEINLLNDFVEKSTNYYIEHKVETDKSYVELQCYSIMFILKSLTGDKSKGLYEYLNELKIKDLDGFKNFVIYLKNRLTLENDKDNILKILHYFIDEKDKINREEKNKDNTLKVSEYEQDNENSNDNLGFVDNVKDGEFIYDIKKKYENKNVYNEDVESVQNYDIYLKENKITKKEYVDLENKEISELFIERILSLNADKDNEFLEEVNKKEKNSSSILETIFVKFLNRQFYCESINDELSKLIPGYIEREGNPFLVVEDLMDDNISLINSKEKENFTLIRKDNIVHKKDLNIENNESNIIEKNDEVENVKVEKQKELNYKKEYTLNDVKQEELKNENKEICVIQQNNKTQVYNVLHQKFLNKYENQALNFEQQQDLKNIKDQEINYVEKNDNSKNFEDIHQKNLEKIKDKEIVSFIENNETHVVDGVNKKEMEEINDQDVNCVKENENINIKTVQQEVINDEKDQALNFIPSKKNDQESNILEQTDVIKFENDNHATEKNNQCQEINFNQESKKEDITRKLSDGIESTGSESSFSIPSEDESKVKDML